MEVDGRVMTDESWSDMLSEMVRSRSVASLRGHSEIDDLRIRVLWNLEGGDRKGISCSHFLSNILDFNRCNDNFINTYHEGFFQPGILYLPILVLIDVED